MRNQYEPRLKTLERGLAGCHGCGVGADGNAFTVTMYDSRLSCYYGDLVEGGFVIDNQAVLDADPSLAYLAPMVSATLHDGEIDRLDARVEPDNFLLGMFAEQPDGYGTVARLAVAQLGASPTEEPGPMDYVSPGRFAAWWANRRARVGQRQGDTIVWTDGTVDQIRSIAERYMVNGVAVTA